MNEVQYHPAWDGVVHPATDDGEGDEFVELHNPGTNPIDLGGWKLTDGVELEFAAGTVLGAGAISWPPGIPPG